MSYVGATTRPVDAEKVPDTVPGTFSLDYVVRGRPGERVDVSFVLVDWSCRESYHLLDYLKRQNVERTRYEVLWVEYYRRSERLCRRIQEAQAAGTDAGVDTYVAMGVPPGVYYHKHLMYNLGILLAAGRIVCICDSDALARPGLVEAIVNQFDKDQAIVLHLDEVRNGDPRFHPFRYPDFMEVTGPGARNWVNGRPAGLAETLPGHADPLHRRNYGACFCARREDLLAIGGADLHTDYLGHICGPYEMTFRLVNAGRREVWHPSEWLYHVWHPGQAGDGNWSGPHDGGQMSTTALSAIESGRVAPLVECPAIARQRERPIALRGDSEERNGTGADDPTHLDQLAPGDWATRWRVDRLHAQGSAYGLGGSLVKSLHRRGAADERESQPPKQQMFARRISRWAAVWLAPLAIAMLWRQLVIRWRAREVNPRIAGTAGGGRPAGKLRALVSFLRRMWRDNRHWMRVCWVHLTYAAAAGHREVVLYGDGQALRMLTALARFSPVTIRAVCSYEEQEIRSSGRLEQWPEEWLRQWPGAVITATFVNTEPRLARLAELGIERQRVIVLQ